MKTVLVIRTTKLDCWRLKLAGIQDFARTKDWRIQLIDGRGVALRIDELLAFWHPEGCIVEADGGATRLTPADFGSLPSVFIDHSPALVGGSSAVIRHDSAAMARLAARELLALERASYAVIGGWHDKAYWVKDKIEAFCQTIALHGDSAHVFWPNAKERRDTTSLRRRLQRWMTELPRPFGIFGVNDLICEIALSAATSAGLAVPEEASFIGADNDSMICETAIPSLSSIQPDFFQSGFRAAELLAQKIEDPALPAQLVVIPPIKVVRRLSSRKLHKSDPLVKKVLIRIERETVYGLTARQVLDDLPCSRRQAEIRFRAATGHSVLEEIQNVRFTQAMDLIRNPSIALGAIADRTGWPSTLVLSRYAAKKTGKTLTKLRNETRMTTSRP